MKYGLFVSEQNGKVVFIQKIKEVVFIRLKRGWFLHTIMYKRSDCFVYIWFTLK